MTKGQQAILQLSRAMSELFELAIDIEDQLCDLREALKKVRDTISKLTKLYPQSPQCPD